MTFNVFGTITHSELKTWLTLSYFKDWSTLLNISCQIRRAGMVWAAVMCMFCCSWSCRWCCLPTVGRGGCGGWADGSLSMRVNKLSYFQMCVRADDARQDGSSVTSVYTADEMWFECTTSENSSILFILLFIIIFWRKSFPLDHIKLFHKWSSKHIRSKRTFPCCSLYMMLVLHLPELYQ